MRKTALICCIILAVGSIFWCIYRDIQIEKLYTNDLRNRVVGSRLQMDGISPYFYHWKTADGLRYYDPQNYSDLKISASTASPFFHQLLYPFANYPQRTTSRIWLAIQYLALLVMVMLAFSKANNTHQKIAVALITLLYLYSYAWTASIEMGQYYIIVPFVTMLLYHFTSRRAGWLNFLLAGITAAALILIRPPAAIILLPLLFIITRFKKNQIIAGVAGFSAILLLAFSTSTSRMYWRDYQQAIGEHIKMHQSLSPTLQTNEAIPQLRQWEGWDWDQIKRDSQHFSYKRNGENGNAFVIFQLLTHRKPSVFLLSITSLILILGLIAFYFKRYRAITPPQLWTIFVFGFCLYMITDIFSPIHRFQYNASQWIFPLLLIAAYYKRNFNKAGVTGVIIGLLLNSVPFVFLPMQRSLGEFIIMLSIFTILFTLKPTAEE